jgi:hypothetical protein
MNHIGSWQTAFVLRRFDYWLFGYWLLFGYCNLVIGYWSLVFGLWSSVYQKKGHGG